MSENAFFWILGIGAAIIAAIGGALWKHITEDAKVRERLATLEADNEKNKEEIKSLRERWHDLRDKTLRDAWNLFQERFEAMKTELRRLIGKE